MNVLRALAVLATLLAAFAPATASEESGVTADEALQRLTEGNRRYVESHFTHDEGCAARRAEVAQGQHPFAIILGCSDSRVPPDDIFDQGLGALFVVRTAGHVADDVALGSIECAAEHLGTPLVVVMWHERCGAVKATVDGGRAPGHIEALVKAIAPAVSQVKGKEGDLLDNAVRANAEQVVDQLRASKPILARWSRRESSGSSRPLTTWTAARWNSGGRRESGGHRRPQPGACTNRASRPLTGRQRLTWVRGIATARSARSPK